MDLLVVSLRHKGQEETKLLVSANNLPLIKSLPRWN